MNKIELTREELTTILQAATVNVKDFVMNNDKFIDEQLKAINHTPCSTEFKVDKKEPTFKEWVYMNNYTPKEKQYYDENSIEWNEYELINMYNDEVMNL